MKRKAVWVDFKPFAVATTKPEALCNEIAKAVRKYAYKQNWQFHYELNEPIDEEIK